ncbi:hypothetical protein [Verrucosispora sp. NA02020]|uniref:hypothetical protein n=1 Tax=Verrucosispora sp. NA02020 TaxID=2742132 RepID=UPI0015924DF0|nr:hypothetical protein [Verrucosispora sp. NA02020]QKW15323.1 hypothetical protein HUT12_22890 [Verrucosispora sp. NA02020]
MAYIAKVDIRRSVSPSMAQCGDCERLPITATRERVRSHVKETGHTAWVVVEHQTQYSAKEEGGSGQ